ncbi:unnamed protein product [Meloidogyne enterolobii]
MLHFKYFSYTINCFCSSKPILYQFSFRTFSACNRSIEFDGNVPEGVSLASGRITSPNYHHSPYLANSSCTTKLIAAEDHRLFLVFKHFELERGRHRMLPQSMLFHRFRPFGINSDNFIGTATRGLIIVYMIISIFVVYHQIIN